LNLILCACNQLLNKVIRLIDVLLDWIKSNKKQKMDLISPWIFGWIARNSSVIAQPNSAQSHRNHVISVNRGRSCRNCLTFLEAGNDLVLPHGALKVEF